VANVASAEETDANEVLKKTLAAYANLPTYSSQCAIAWSFSAKGISFRHNRQMSIKMRKSNQFFITDREKITAPQPLNVKSSTIWNEGKQPCIFTQPLQGNPPSPPFWSKTKDTKSMLDLELDGFGRPDCVPQLFFLAETLDASPFSSLVEPQLSKSEKIAGEDCYVIGNKSKSYTKESYWISKADFLIRQYSQSTDAAQELLERNFGQTVDEEARATGRTLTTAERSAKITAKIKEYRAPQPSGTVTATYSKIETPDFKDADFAFKLPPGTKYHMLPAQFGGVPE
jgi:hypothetical protein